MRLGQHQPASRSCLPENVKQWVCSCMQLCTKITSRAIAGPCCSEIVGYCLARRHACGTASAGCRCAPLRIPQPPPDTHPQCTHRAPAACTCTSASSHTTFKTPACKCTQHVPQAFSTPVLFKMTPKANLCVPRSSHHRFKKNWHRQVTAVQHAGSHNNSQTDADT